MQAGTSRRPLDRLSRALPGLGVLVLTLAGLVACAQPSVRSDSSRPGHQGEVALAHQEVTIRVAGMTWPSSCVRRVRTALARVPGVVEVEIDFNQRQVTVLMEAEEFDAGALLEALHRAGYTGVVLPPQA